MPYINVDRLKYRDIILSTIQSCGQDRHTRTALYYGHFAFGLVRRTLGGGSGWFSHEESPFVTRKPFQVEPPAEIVQIDANLQTLHNLLSSDVDVLMGELNYVLSAVAWGLLEKETPYCLRAYVKGILLTAVEELCKTNSIYINMLVLGLLFDVIDEFPFDLCEDE